MSYADIITADSRIQSNKLNVRALIKSVQILQYVNVLLRNLYAVGLFPD